MPKSTAKRPIIQHTIDEGVQVQPKNGKEMQDLLRKARVTMMRLDAENQSLKRLRESTRLFTPKSDCDAETSTDDMPRRKRVVRRNFFVRRGADRFSTDAEDTLESFISTSNSRLPASKVTTVARQEAAPVSKEVLSDFGTIMYKKRMTLKNQVSNFQRELDSDVKKMLRKAKKDNPMVSSLRESFDRIGRLIANLKSDLEVPEKPPEKQTSTDFYERRRGIAQKLRELSKGENSLVETVGY